MDKEEFRIKLEEINRLVETKDYKGAMDVVDSIDWRRVKNVRTLCVVGEIYAANKKYEDSKEIFRLAYHRSPIGKNILYRLVEICLKTGDIEDAEDYYDEFCVVAPHDSNSYILKYKILKAKNAPVEEQIRVLEDYKEKEFTEKWSYELANLYYKSGQKDKCQEICDEMILWFSEGNYIVKALNLKSKMGTLTEKEKEKYEEQILPVVSKKEEKEEKKPAEETAEGSSSEEKEAETGEETADTEEEAVPSAEESPDLEEDRDNPQIDSILIKNERDLQDAETLQEKISKGIRDLFGGIRKEIGPSSEDAEYKTEEGEESEENALEGEDADIDISQVPELETEGEVSSTLARKRKGFSFWSSSKKAAEKEDEDFPHIEETQLEEEEEPEEEFEEPEEPESEPVPEEKEEKTVFADEETAFEEPEEKFNLEDTILAAASAQGIDIPDEPEPEPESEEEPEEGEDLSEESGEGEEISVEEAIAEETDEEDFEESVPDLEFPDLKTDEINLEEVEDKSILPKPLEKKDLFTEESYQDEDILMEEEYKEEEPEEEYEEEDDDDLSEEERLEKFIDSKNPPQKNVVDIIPRENKLRDEETKLFSYFVKVPGMKEQILNTLIDVQEGASDQTSRTGNVIVMGGVETGKTRLISGLIPAICKELHLEASKVAYVFAEQINGKNIDRIVEKLAGGFLVIEKANQLDQKTADALNRAMERDTDGMIFILEDDKIGMRKMIARYPKLAKKFTSIINIPVFTNDELAYFAKVYAMENGYKIDNMGMLALYNLIGLNQKEDMPMNIGAVKNIIDDAILRSQGGLKLFRKKTSKKRMDADGYIMLFEKDFAIR